MLSASDAHLFYGMRLLGALILATLVPLLIDRHARHSSRVHE